MLARLPVAIVVSAVLMALWAHPAVAVDPQFFPSRPFGTGSDSANSLVTGDMDGDGDLDIVTGNYNERNVLFLNDGAGNFVTSRNIGLGGDGTLNVALGDMNGDGDLDVVTLNAGLNAVYLNDGAGNFAAARTFDVRWDDSSALAMGDLDNDGDLDVITGKKRQASANYFNGSSNNLPLRAQLNRPITTKFANFYSSPQIVSDRLVAVPYRLIGVGSNLIGRIEMQYSFDGGGRWLPAVAAPGTQTTNLAISPAGVEHVFTWDTFASSFFGQSDNVVLRLVIYAQPAQPAAAGTYRYVNSASGPFPRAYFAAQTFPFRVRGTQVRVLQGNRPQPNAFVYRLPASAERGGQAMGNVAGAYRTSAQGNLSGRGQLDLGDRLLALVPVSQTATYGVYYTSPIDPSTGLPTYTISEAGVQTLTVSSDNPLVLFNLDVALEWDASKDATYLGQLQYDLNRTSELLYDWSNGQAALGRIRVFHDARRLPVGSDGYQPWLNGHIRVYASNEVHPSAIQGGIVPDRLVETTPNGKSISYTPGMVHIGAVWNRYAESSGLGEDWPRALAHELAHYLFFLDDNYIGQASDGSIQFVSSDPTSGCPGAMNDPYTDFLAKFQPQPSWLPGCTATYSQQSLGRSDWETIVTHYPWLKAPAAPIAQVNPGPSGLRLAFTQFEVVPPAPAPVEQQTLGLPIFTISTFSGSAYQPSPDAQAFLLQGSRLVELGAPSLDQLVARGARNGDTLCLLEPDNQRAGCVATTPGVDQLVVQAVSDWQPQVIFSPVTSRTLSVQVLGLAAGLSLKAQLYPRDGDATQAIDLTPTVSGYAATFNLPEAVFEGSLRIWDANNSLRQVLSGFVLGSNPERWDARDARWRSRLARWRSRLVPVISSGGKVAVLGDNVAFGSEDWLFSLQTATALPNLPDWATPIGQGYWLHASANAPSLANTAVSFNYDSRDVPPGQESALRVFFWNGSAWTPQPTNVNPDQGIASAPTQGPGLYALVAAIEIPLKGPGWNNFAYAVVGDPTSVGEALRSIAGLYSIVYAYEPTNAADPWRAYDPTAPGWANDLKTLEYGKAYWLYARQSTILHPSAGDTLQVASPAAPTGATLGLVPPAVIYGAVHAAQDFVPQPGMTVTAWIDSHDCGRAQTQALGNDIVYAIDVAADATEPGCGATGRTVRFTVDGREMPAQVGWSNTSATNALLGAAADGWLYLPSLLR